jgi:putative transposase
VVMNNHIHLLATPMADKGLSKMMQSIAQQYAQYFNQKYRYTGSLWGGRFQNCVIEDEDYLLYCYAYIENNPVRTGIVSFIGEYRWSSYAENTNTVAKTIVTPHDLYKALGKNQIDRGENYRAFLNLELEESYINRIRQCTRRGRTI